MRKKALITGITGQDGSYLAELLLEKGYEVHGLVRRSSSFNTARIEHLFQDPHDDEARLFLHYGDVTDGTHLVRLLSTLQPDEVYNFAAQSHVRVSFDTPEYTSDVNALGAIRLLEAIRILEIPARFYQASSSELFGATPPPQNEESKFHPRSPYAVAKLYAHWMTINYRESYDFHASTGILFNHESPRRGNTFVTRKIARAIPRLITGDQKFLYLGNLDARRDWGHARDFMRAVYMITQRDTPGDYVIGTGESHSVKDFVDLAFGMVGLDPEKFVRIDSRYIRPAEVNHLCADITKAENELKWRPAISFEDLVWEMVDAELIEYGLNGLSKSK
jgi:GDPmannose 4,6-dehydratase